MTAAEERFAARGRYRRGRRLRTAAVVGAVIVVLAGIGLAAFGLGGGHPAPPPRPDRPPATAAVTRSTLTETLRLPGTLGYGAPMEVTAREAMGSDSPGVTSDGDGDGTSVTGQGAGTLTWLPRVGAIVKPGQVLFRVDDRPVVLLSGRIPLYRLLADGVEGADVALLERNLSAFGYTGFTVDSTFSWATAAAVKRWQADLGLEQTGTVDVSQVVVARGRVRIAEHVAALGAAASGPVLTYTGTRRVVTITLDVAQQHLVRPGLKARVTLPDGSTVPGKVASIGRVAIASSDEQGGEQGPTLPVIVTISDQAALGRLDAAPVELTLVVAERKDVLTVPVGALVALSEGGYGVQVVEGSTSRYVAVETGMFADGRVEISGDGIAEGMTVGVPA